MGVCGGGYGNSVHSAQLCCEPKSALKIKYFKKKKVGGEKMRFAMSPPGAKSLG